MHNPATARRGNGFTLIELLVVVAIIALLISILLPTLSKARAQARTTLCLTRIGELCQAFLLYYEDHRDFPFLSTLHHSYAEGPDPNETWLADWLAQPDPATAIATVAYRPYEEWGVMKDAVPRSGTLFPYSRFGSLYRCPDFERQNESEQHVFNYTRAVWARVWWLAQDYEIHGRTPPSEWGGVDGRIMRLENIHSPAELPIILDEQWNRHVGTAGLVGHHDSAYNGADYGFFKDNIIAIAHGAPVTSRFHDHDYSQFDGFDPLLWKRGGVACYDGHAELMRDPWPTFASGNNGRRGPWRSQASSGGRMLEEIMALQAFMTRIIYTQRGFDPQYRYGHPPKPWR